MISPIPEMFILMFLGQCLNIFWKIKEENVSNPNYGLSDYWKKNKWATMGSFLSVLILGYIFAVGGTATTLALSGDAFSRLILYVSAGSSPETILRRSQEIASNSEIGKKWLKLPLNKDDKEG